MVSLKLILINLLRFRKFPKCIVTIGKHTPKTAYIISANHDDNVSIGKYCSIGYGVVIIANQGHNLTTGYRDYRVATYPVSLVGNHGFRESYFLPEKRNFVFIGNDVLLGAYAIVLPGVIIGDGAIVGAGSVVTKDVPPYSIVAGNPAKILRYRYSRDHIEKLLKIAWWNWSEKKIVANMDLFYGKVDVFINKFSDESELSNSN